MFLCAACLKPGYDAVPKAYGLRYHTQCLPKATAREVLTRHVRKQYLKPLPKAVVWSGGRPEQKG